KLKNAKENPEHWQILDHYAIEQMLFAGDDTRDDTWGETHDFPYTLSIDLSDAGWLDTVDIKSVSRTEQIKRLKITIPENVDLTHKYLDDVFKKIRNLAKKMYGDAGDPLPFEVTLSYENSELGEMPDLSCYPISELVFHGVALTK